MLITFFHFKGVVQFGSIAQGQTVNRTYYMEIFNCYMKLCVGKGLNFGPTIGFSTVTMLHLIRRSMSSSFWTKKWIIEMQHPPYSPALDTNDYWLFPKTQFA
jgi:hypothetical protein